MTPEQIADGWIEHDGGECPVLEGKVWVMWENGLTCLQPAKPSWWTSWNKPARYDRRRRQVGRIIAYRKDQPHDT
jgi:hypothetical protein